MRNIKIRSLIISKELISRVKLLRDSGSSKRKSTINTFYQRQVYLYFSLDTRDKPARELTPRFHSASFQGGKIRSMNDSSGLGIRLYLTSRKVGIHFLPKS